MKPLVNIQKFLSLLLALVLCASMVGTVRAGVTIQSLIDAAPDGGTVTIAAGTFSETLLVDKNLTLKGVSFADTILQPASPTQRVIKVTDGHNLRLETLRVTGGHPTAPGDDSGGGVLLVGGSLTMDHVRVDHNQATYGGGVFQGGASGSITTSDCVIDNNTASNSGGGAYAAGTGALSYTLLNANTAGFHGGGIHVNSGSASLYFGSATDNHALNGNGGGVNVNNALFVFGTQFTGNTAAGYGDTAGSGGAICQWNAGVTVSIDNAGFSGNSAKYRGGAAMIRESFLTLSNATFTENSVDSGTAGSVYGGAVYAGGGLTGNKLTFTSNSAKCLSGIGGCPFMNGGALHIKRPSVGPSSITLSTFNSNFSWFGSAISSESSVQLALTSSTFINNGSLMTGAKSGYGGAVDAYWVQGDKILFQDNKAANEGGAVHGSHIALTNSRFISNATESYGLGGGVFSHHNLTGTNLLFVSNIASSGAAVYVDQGTAVLKHLTIARPIRSTVSGIFVNTSANVELKNSIVSAEHTAIRAVGTVTEDYNLYFNNGVDYDATGGGTINFGAHNVALQDPLFVSPTGNDYHLRWLSPAIGKGANLGVTTDLDGLARHVRMDIGAYQFWAKLSLPLIRK